MSVFIHDRVHGAAPGLKIKPSLELDSVINWSHTPVSLKIYVPSCEIPTNISLPLRLCVEWDNPGNFAYVHVYG